MAATKRTSPSSSLIHPHPSSSSSRNHHQRFNRSSSCNHLNLQLRFSPTNSNSVTTTVTNPKRKCLCSPTTHPGSFRCAYHRGLEKEKRKKDEEEKRSDVGLNLRKTALINSLVRFGSVEAERFRVGLVNTLVRPSVFNFRRKSEFTPRLSRFYVMHKDDQD